MKVYKQKMFIKNYVSKKKTVNIMVRKSMIMKMRVLEEKKKVFKRVKEK